MGMFNSDIDIRIVVYVVELSLTFSLIYWMRSSVTSRPPTWRFLFRLLGAGGVAALIAAYIEIKYFIDIKSLSVTAPQLVQKYGTWYDLINNFSASAIEELAKYTVAVYTLLSTKQVRKLSDAIIYLILIGLGFSLVEDIVFLLNPDIVAPYRLLSFYVHSGTSAVIGYSMGRFMSGVTRYPELIISILGAIALHFLYNLSTSVQPSNYAVWLTSAIAFYISLQIFILFRKAIEEEYRLGHRFRGGETAQKLLNLTPEKK